MLRRNHVVDGDDRRIPRILITGSFGFGNLGDEAILDGVLQQLRGLDPEPEILVVAGNPEVAKREHGVRTIGWADWPGIVEAVAGADLVIQGGGGLFFDYGEFDPGRLLEPCAPNLQHFASFPLLAWLFDTPLMIYGCGVGPLLSESAERIVRESFAVAAVATVRDRGSLSELERIGADTTTVTVSSDPAFLLAPADSGHVDTLLEAMGLETDRPLIGVVVMPWERAISEDEWMGVLAASVSELAASEGASVVVIPFHPGYDDEVVERFVRETTVPVAKLGQDLGPALVEGIMSRCKLCVSMRLHGLILSAAAHTPTVSLAYSPKVRSFAGVLGLEDQCLDFSELDRLSRVLRSAWTEREELAARVRIAARASREAAAKDVQHVGMLLDRTVDGGTRSAGMCGIAGRAIADTFREAHGPPSREELNASLRESEARVADLRQVLRERDVSLQAATAALRETEHRLSETAEVLQGVREERDQLHGRLNDAWQQNEVALASLHEVSARLENLESTKVVRMMNAYWKLRLAPDGSR